MTDETTQPSTETPAAQPPVAAPAVTPAISPDIEALLNERIAGVQRTFQTQLNERDTIINQLKTATLSEDERAQLVQDERESELESLRTQIWLSEQAKERPKAAEIYQKLLTVEDPDAALLLLESYVASQAPAPVAPEPETLVPDVDPNNPSRFSSNEKSFTLSDGTVLTDQIAENILKGMDRWPTR
ncbi:MAG: hypothetical protein ABI720_13300 [Actinomycetes bacterium]